MTSPGRLVYPLPSADERERERLLNDDDSINHPLHIRLIRDCNGRRLPPPSNPFFKSSNAFTYAWPMVDFVAPYNVSLCEERALSAQLSI